MERQRRKYKRYNTDPAVPLPKTTKWRIMVNQHPRQQAILLQLINLQASIHHKLIQWAHSLNQECFIHSLALLEFKSSDLLYTTSHNNYIILGNSRPQPPNKRRKLYNQHFGIKKGVQVSLISFDASFSISKRYNYNLLQ